MLNIYLAIVEDYVSSKVSVNGDFNAAIETTFETQLLDWSYAPSMN